MRSCHLHLPHSTRTLHQPFKHTLVAQKIHPQDPSGVQPRTVADPGDKRIGEVGTIELVELFVEVMLVLDLHVELVVNLLKDVMDGNTVGMDLLDIDVPGQARM